MGERFLRVQAGDTPVPVKQTGSGLLLHLVPLINFAQERHLPIESLKSQYNLLQLIASNGWGPQINLDGFTVYGANPDAFSEYTHVFRSGAIEAHINDPFGDRDGDKFLPGEWLPEQLVQFSDQYLKAIAALRLKGPTTLSLGFFDAAVVMLATRRRGVPTRSAAFSKHEMRIPMV